MYELKCPSCEHVTRSSFVRIGAAVSCASCGHTYRVTEAHVTRRVGTTSGASADPLLPQADGPSAAGDAMPSAADAGDGPVQGEAVELEPPPAPAGDRRRLWLYVSVGAAALVVLFVMLLLVSGGERDAEADVPAPDGAGILFQPHASRPITVSFSGDPFARHARAAEHLYHWG